MNRSPAMNSSGEQPGRPAARQEQTASPGIEYQQPGAPAAHYQPGPV